MVRLRRPRRPLHAARQALAAALAVAALVLALRPAPAPAGAPATVPVVVAAADLAPGTVLGEGDLTVARYPPSLRPAGAVEDPAAAVGQALAGGVRAGEPVTDAGLVGSAVTGQLVAGQVAAPVRPADLAVSALVHPGDRVDVLATAPGAARAEVVAAGAPVLATPGPDDDGLLLLAVDADTAARLAAAATTSTLTLSLPPRPPPGAGPPAPRVGG
ncbi:Flp pilus assembly protein CpaB [Geodermatophilus sp. DSM 45219]|uniref:Flp pilus assembly protein CpaB n=1 Tax=Geodermatophilus sp. DSM 45219 TaxID=1881103 RepID=UPI00088E2CD2|nr:Flp pilus assembly protein CpaB [Geodermatophilus sp. DSM 45219]SDN46357.1 Flp pilus assembly protein CpaB [Geodermatophilus sp. DSM 45219]